MKLPSRAVCLAAALFLPFPPVSAGEDKATSLPEKSPLMQWLEGDYLLGDWSSVRPHLSEQGVDFEFFYFGSLPSNLDGGIRTGSDYQGAFLATLGLDTEKLWGHPGGNFYLSSIWIHGGENFSNRHIGDFNKVNLTDFDNMFRLWEMWYSQSLLEDKLTLKAGLMSADRDFIVPEYYNSIGSINFLNQTFFFPTLAFNLYEIPGFPVGNHSLPSTPFASLGFLARYQPSDAFYVQAAVYDGNPDQSDHGTNFRIAPDEGALVYAETGTHWNASPAADGLPGSLKVGGFYHTDEFFDAYQGASYLIANALGAPAVAPRERSGNWGVYLLAEQYLWLEQGKDDPAMQGALGFFRVAAAPKDRNLTQFGIDGGVVLKGLIPGRDWDTLGLGLSYLHISEDLREAVRDANRAYGTDFLLPDYEGLVELSYKAQLTAWWTLQPSVQWVLHPGGRTDLATQPGDAIAFVLQTTLRF